MKLSELMNILEDPQACAYVVNTIGDIGAPHKVRPVALRAEGHGKFRVEVLPWQVYISDARGLYQSDLPVFLKLESLGVSDFEAEYLFAIDYKKELLRMIETYKENLCDAESQVGMLDAIITQMEMYDE